MAKASADTPLMQQHRAIKQKYPDAVLLFRVGDFYETFGQDAVVASQVLGITLTRRNNGAASESELAGFPHHALDTYLHKLVKAGYRVAICDQLEDPKLAKGIVKRGVTELVTPGVATNDKLLEYNQNNFLCALHCIGEDAFGICFADISTGEMLVAEGDKEYTDKLLQSMQPAEVIFQRQFQKKIKEWFGLRLSTYALDEWVFDGNYAEEILLRQFATHSLKGFGVHDMPLAIVAAGAVFHYLRDTEHLQLQHFKGMQRINRGDHLWMDRFTMRNLELVGNAEGKRYLLNVLDHCASPMGGRLLKRWLLMPLADADKIQQRLDAVEWLAANTDERLALQQALKHCGDLERLAAKLPLRKINPREVLQLGRALHHAEACMQLLKSKANNYLLHLADLINPCLELQHKIVNTLHTQPPAQLGKGQVIATGINAELDELRELSGQGRQYLTQLQEREALATGITSLKVSYNNVFGYYLEVTNAHKTRVPESWIRKQTLVNAERYITQELKTYEEKITTAESKIENLEAEHFHNLLNTCAEAIEALQTNAHVLAIADVLCSFAHQALQANYCKPQVHKGCDLHITAGRHPVIESQLPAGEQYVSNDIELDPESLQIMILTGPNMSGKSALLRQTALITLMAHMGSFVPATAAKVPLTDKIFTRVGASDNLSGGESTFMVEMNETASIVNNLSERSLVLLDEIGRGTSTYDGISIAWSLVEFLHTHPAAPKTLFATHYHELNELEHACERVKNYHITNKESGNKIIFLRKLAPGGSKHSFGIHVARMAGMPASLITRANNILSSLEQKATAAPAETLNHKVKQLPAGKMQLSIFDEHSEVFSRIRTSLEAIDVNRLTPVEALLKLNEIKEHLK